MIMDSVADSCHDMQLTGHEPLLRLSPPKWLSYAHMSGNRVTSGLLGWDPFACLEPVLWPLHRATSPTMGTSHPSQ